MARSLMSVSVLAFLLATAASSAHADPQADLKEMREYFQKKFPTVSFDDYANGFYVLPGFEAYKTQWESYNEFPPYEIGLAEGKTIWETPFPNGKTFASCFKNEGKNIAQHFPYWHEPTQKVRTAEMDLMDCARNNGSKLAFLTADLNRDGKARGQLAGLSAHFYSLSRGQRIQIDVSQPGAAKAFEAGQKFWWSRRGQLNFACSHCHVQMAGKNLGGNQPLSAALGHTTAWPAYRIEWQRLETLHFRYMTCNSQVRAKPFKHGSEVYNNLEFYERFMSNGLQLTAPAMRN